MTDLGQYREGDPLPGLPETSPKKRRRLPKGVEPGHRYSYVAGARMGMAYANADGSWSVRPNKGGLPVSWLHQAAQRPTFTHAPLDCAGCARSTA